VTSNLGQADFIFTEGMAAYEMGLETCDFIFDADDENQPSTCINAGTQQETKISQNCQGEGSGCDVMSNMCTLFGYSGEADMAAAFSSQARPNMDYGACLPCECDPIAEIVNLGPLVSSDESMQLRSTSAQNQLAGITTTTGFVMLADVYFLGAVEFPWSAEKSPGRQALTKAIGDGQVLDFTSQSVTLDLLLSAQMFYVAECATRVASGNPCDVNRRRLQDAQLEDLGSIIADLNNWYFEQDESGIDAINDANEYAALSDYIFDMLVDGVLPAIIFEEELGSGDSIVISDLIEQVSGDIRIYTYSPTASPTINPEWEVCMSADIGEAPKFLVSNFAQQPIRSGGLLFVAGATSVVVYNLELVELRRFADFQAVDIASSSSGGSSKTLALNGVSGGLNLFLLEEDGVFEEMPLGLTIVSGVGRVTMSLSVDGDQLTVLYTSGDIFVFDVNDLVANARTVGGSQDDGTLTIIIAVVVSALVVGGGGTGFFLYKRRGSSNSGLTDDDKIRALTISEDSNREIINMQGSSMDDGLAVAIDLDDSNELPSASI